MPSATPHIWLTVLLFIIFIGIVVWAYSKRQKRRFHEASQLPFADEPQVKEQEKNNE